MSNKFPSTVPGDHSLILRAVELAIVAHDGQRRKYTNDPYVTHPVAVAKMVADRTMDPHVIAAAVLHDVVEDSPVTLDEIRADFGERIATIVGELTDKYTHEAFPELNRKARKAAEVARFSTASKEAQLVKACDMLHNMWDIDLHDPDFAVVYRREKLLLLDVMPDVDPHLRMLLED